VILLSPHFTLKEMTRSAIAIRHGIDNTPDQRVLENLKVLAEGLERVRTILNRSVHISSGYRCLALNTAAKGAKDSAHIDGRAADFECDGFGSPEAVAQEIIKYRDFIRFDKLILEYPPDGWVHIQFQPKLGMPRNEALVFRGGDYEKYVA
jgi:hypothetical protein